MLTFHHGRFNLQFSYKRRIIYHPFFGSALLGIMTLGTIWAREGFVLGTAALRRVMNFGTKKTSDHRLTRRLSDCCDGCTNSVEAFEWFALKLGC